MTRALLASRAELCDAIDDEDHELLREMALTLSAAFARLRFLNSLEGRP